MSEQQCNPRITSAKWFKALLFISLICVPMLLAFGPLLFWPSVSTGWIVSVIVAAFFTGMTLIQTGEEDVLGFGFRLIVAAAIIAAIFFGAW